MHDPDCDLLIFDWRAEKSPPRRVDSLGALGSMTWAGKTLLVEARQITDLASLFVPTVQLHAIDAETGTSKPLGKGKAIIGASLVHADPDGRFALVASARDTLTAPGVDRVDLATGATTRVEKPTRDIRRWLADGQGVIRAGMSYGATRWKLHFRDAPGAEFRTIEAQRYDETAGSDVGIARILSADGRGYIMTNGPTGRHAVYAYDFRTDTYGETLWSHPESDAVSASSNPITGALESVTWEDDRPRVKWFHADLAALQAQLDRKFPDHENAIVNRSRDGNFVLFVSRAPHHPGTYYVFDRKARRMQVFAAVVDGLAEAKLAPVRPIRYSARDGLSIPAYLTLPSGRTGKDLPLVVMPHGGPFVRDSWTYDPFVQFLASRGYAVLQPNFRGSTGYGVEFLAKAYGQFGRAMQDDIDDGVDELVKQGIVDPKRVCIMGASYGGYAAIWGAMRNPERYRCAVSFAGVTDVKAMLRVERGRTDRKYYRHLEAQIRGADKADMDAVSPVRQAARLTIPLLLAHGEQDSNVPPEQARKLVAALKKARRPVETVYYPHAGHGLTRPQDMADYLRRVEAFLAKHNPA